jgi:hypothetical protein
MAEPLSPTLPSLDGACVMHYGDTLHGADFQVAPNIRQGLPQNKDAHRREKRDYETFEHRRYPLSILCALAHRANPSV